MGWKDSMMPKFDFSKSIFLVISHDAANRSLAGGWIALVSEKGRYGVMARTYNKIKWQPSDRVSVVFLEVPREEIGDYVRKPTPQSKE